ncbi:MAG: phosphotransferase family protein [Spirochaetales bacterium]
MNVQEQVLQETIDPFLSDRALSRIASEALEQEVWVEGYRVLTGGCWNRVVGIRAGERDLVVKIAPRTADEGIAREFSVLSMFVEQSELPVPEPLLVSTEGEVIPGSLLVMSRVPGAVMHECFGLLNYGQRRAITDQIAADLSRLHEIRGEGFGGVELAPGERFASWPEFWLPRYDRVLEEVAASGSIPSDILDGAYKLRPMLEEPLSIGSSSTLTHYDIWSGNVMIDLESGPPRVSGYIDIPGYYADYARELSFAMLFGIANRRFFATYLESHQLDPGFELRANIYNVKMNIKHIQMYPHQMVYQQGARENLRFALSELGG